MNKEEWLKKGYVTEPVDKALDLKAEIDKLRKEKTQSSSGITTRLTKYRK